MELPLWWQGVTLELLLGTAEIDQAVSLINNKPRKILGYESALEVAMRAGIINSIKSESVLILG